MHHALLGTLCHVLGLSLLLPFHARVPQTETLIRLSIVINISTDERCFLLGLAIFELCELENTSGLWGRAGVPKPNRLLINDSKVRNHQRLELP